MIQRDTCNRLCTVQPVTKMNHRIMKMRLVTQMGGFLNFLVSYVCKIDRIALIARCFNDDVSGGFWATGEGSTEKIFVVPGRNRTHDLLSDVLISELKGICEHLVLSLDWSGDRIKIINRPRL